MPSRVRHSGLTVLGLVLLAGCGEATPLVEDGGPLRPSAVGEPLVVEYGPIGSPVVLDPVPEGFTVSTLTLDEAHPAAFAPEATLYGDPSFDDTLDGPVLLVGDSGGSANLGGAPRGRPDERRLDVGRFGGWITHDGATTYVGLEVDGQDYARFLIGRGLTDEEMIAAAQTATFDQVARVDTGSLPDGMQSLIESGPGDGPFRYGSRGLFMVLSGPDAQVQVVVVRADPRLAAMWGFWTGDAVGTEISGVPGSDGALGGTSMYSGERGLVWAEDGLVYAVTGMGGTPVDAVAAGLRPGTDAEFAAMLQTQQDREVTAQDLGCRPGSGVVSAMAGDVRWAFAVGQNSGGGWDSCSGVVPLGEFPGGGAFGSFELAELGRISSQTLQTNVEAGGPTSTLIAGVAPPGTSRIALAPPGREAVDAVLAEGGPRAGEVMWGQWLPGYGYEPTDPVVLTAYNAEGAVLDTRPTR